MKKTIISRVKRLNTLYDHVVNLTSLPVPTFQKESIDLDGRILQRTVQVTINLRDIFVKFKAQDFSLENILAIGATDHLRPIPSLVSNDIDTSLLSLDSVMDLVDAFDAKRVSQKVELVNQETLKENTDV